jgi:hypothetical protein
LKNSGIEEIPVNPNVSKSSIGGQNKYREENAKFNDTKSGIFHTG